MKEALVALESGDFRTAALAWLNESSELLIDVGAGNTGGSYLVSSAAQLDMLTEMTISGALLTVLRGQPFPLRGRVDEEFIRQAVAHFVVKDTYQVIAPRV